MNASNDGQPALDLLQQALQMEPPVPCHLRKNHFPHGGFLDSKQVDLKSSECKMSECGTSDVRWPNQRVVPEKRPMPSRRVKLLSHWRTKSISAAVIFHSFGSFVSNSVSSDMSFRKYLECRHIFHYFSMISLFSYSGHD